MKRFKVYARDGRDFVVFAWSVAEAERKALLAANGRIEILFTKEVA